MFNKLLICLCLADLLFLLSNIAVSPVSLQVRVSVLSPQHIDHLPACLDPLAVQHPDVPQPGVRQSLQSLHLSIPHRKLHRGEAPGLF